MAQAALLVLCFCILVCVGAAADDGHIILFPDGSATTRDATDLPSNGRSLPETRVAMNEAPKKSFVRREKPSCLGVNDVAGLCADDEEYDADIRMRFMNAIQNSNLDGKVGDIFSGLLLDDISNQIFVDLTRSGLMQEDPICPGREKIIYPKRGQTKDNEWVFLLNLEQEGLQQGIRVEECVNENSECAIGREAGIDSVCRQKFIFKKLLAMDRTGTQIAPESILVPSCCVCYVRSLLPRFGRNTTFPASPPSSPIPEGPLTNFSLSFPDLVNRTGSNNNLK